MIALCSLSQQLSLRTFLRKSFSAPPYEYQARMGRQYGNFVEVFYTADVFRVGVRAQRAGCRSQCAQQDDLSDSSFHGYWLCMILRTPETDLTRNGACAG
jgi:hypothetical protein